MTTWEGILAGLAAGVLCLAVTWPLARWLSAAGLVDRPNHRSMHTTEVPRGGGAGFALAVAVVVLVAAAGGLDGRSLLVLALASGLAAVGFVDDRFNLAFTPRLVAQLLLAGAALAIVRASSISTVTHWAVAPTAVVTVIWILGCCNAVNFMDGIDGITGSHVVVFGLHLVAVGHQDELVWFPALLAVGAALGFLHWNAVRRVVFLGDGGAYFIGAFLGLLVVLASVRTSTPLIAAAPFAVYAADTSTTFARCIVRRRELTRGHREHVYQRLVLAGHGHLPIALFAAVCSAACSAAAIAVDREWVVPAVGAAAAAVVVAAYLSAPRWMPSRPDTSSRSRPRAAETSER